MDKEMEGLLLSAAYIALILSLSWTARKYIKGIAHQAVRKFAHITLSLWYFIFAEYMAAADAVLIWIGPAVLVVLTGFAALSKKLRFLTLEAKGSSVYGVTFYSISVLLLLLIYCYEPFGISFRKELVGVGLLTMGFGDGLAGLVGSLFSKAKRVPHLAGRKTWAGIITMLAVSTVVIGWVLEKDFQSIFSDSFALYLTAGVVATVLEAVTPNGLDNITVPLGTALYVYAIGL